MIRPNPSLSSKLKSIGVLLAEEESKAIYSDIEETLVESCLEFPHDKRLAGLILSWVDVYGGIVNVGKLKKLLSLYPVERYPDIKWVNLLGAFAVHRKLLKWPDLIRNYGSSPMYLFGERATLSAIKLKGKEEWASPFQIYIPKDSLRLRNSIIIPPQRLTKLNSQIRNRYRFGPNYRADIFTLFEEGIRTPSAIVKRLGCSKQVAGRVLKDIDILGLDTQFS